MSRTLLRDIFRVYTGRYMDMMDTIPRLIIAIVLNALIAAATYFAKQISRSGAIGGFVVGALIYFFTDWRGYIVLVSFFVLGTIVTKVKYRDKAAKGIAQEDQGRRGAKHAVANCSASLILGAAAFILSVLKNEHAAMLLMAGFAGGFATALSDTCSSEIGQAFGKTTILLTSLKRVPPGTEGAVSLEGTFAGIVGSLILAAIAAAAGVIHGWLGIVAVVIAAFVGNTLESIIGSTIEKLPFVTNEVTNFINTVIGAAAAIGIYALMT
jgi:uncharacterized protein (TIGR00297 family)